MDQQTKGRFYVRVALVVLAVLSALVSIALFGRELPLSPIVDVQLNAPTDVDSNGAHTVIVDSESRRALILNATDSLTGVINCDALNAPVDAITDVCVVGNTVYVAGVQYQKDSDVIARERLVAYDVHGRSESVVYDVEANDLVPAIKSMDGSGDHTYLVLVYDGVDVGAQGSYDAVRSRVRIIKANRRGFEEIGQDYVELSNVFDVGYSAAANKLHTISMRGVLDDDYGLDVTATANPDKPSAEVARKTADAVANTAADESADAEDSLLVDSMFTSLDVSDKGVVYLYDDVDSELCSLNEDGTLEVLETRKGLTGIHVNGEYLSLCDHESGSVMVSDLNNIGFRELSSVSLAPSMAVLVTVTSMSHVYLALFVVVMLYKKLRSVIAAGNIRNAGPMVASAAVVMVVALAIGYISYGSYKVMTQTRIREIDTFADYMSLTASELSESMEKCSDRDVYRKNDQALRDAYTSMLQLDIHVDGLARVATANGVGTYANVYGKDESGVFYVSDSSFEHVLGSTVTADLHDEIQKVFDTNDADSKTREGKSLRDATQYRLVRIPTSDGEGTAGVVEIGSRIRSFESSLTSDLTQRILALLVMMLVVYLTYSELRACARCFVAYGELKHHHDAIAVLTRPFSFFITILASIDSVMTTLIARALIGSTGMGQNGVLLAFPAVMLGVGLAVGQALYGIFGSRTVINKLMTRGAVAMVFAALFAAVAVWMGNFWLYCLAKLFMAIPFGLLYTLTYSLPRRADTYAIRALAAGGVKRTDTSAAALGTVAGGYVAQALGNEWVYVLVAIASVIVLVMAARLLPRTKHPLEHEIRGEESNHGAIIKLITSKTTLPIVFFVMLPAILAAGYNSFLFPLFSANLGIETSAINNLFVLGQLVVYICIPYLERLDEHYDKWRVAWVSVGLMAVVFLLFSFNTTLVWAVVTIALVGVLCKASDAWKAMWPRSAKAAGLTTGVATASMFAVRSILLIVQPLLLAALLAAGSSLPVIALGAVCAVCSLAFYFITRKSRLAPHDDLSLQEELMSDDTMLP